MDFRYSGLPACVERGGGDNENGRVNEQREHERHRGINSRKLDSLAFTFGGLLELLAVDFASLPLKDAIVIKQGTGTRKVAVFVDPNCGYCKRFERDLAGIKDLTVYTFLLPILGPDSTAKSRAIWCAKDGGKAWRAWMLDNVVPDAAKASCDVAGIDRNLEFGRKHKINGTPAVLFEDGTRKPGAIPAEMLERLLAQASKKS